MGADGRWATFFSAAVRWRRLAFLFVVSGSPVRFPETRLPSEAYVSPRPPLRRADGCLGTVSLELRGPAAGDGPQSALQRSTPSAALSTLLPSLVTNGTKPLKLQLQKYFIINLMKFIIVNRPTLWIINA